MFEMRRETSQAQCQEDDAAGHAGPVSGRATMRVLTPTNGKDETMTDQQTMTTRELLEHILATAGGQAENAGTIAAAALLIREGLDNLAEALQPRELTTAELFGDSQESMGELAAEQTDDKAPPDC